jgi:hypothetical protein
MKKKKTRLDLLNDFARVARPIMLEYMLRDGCIGATFVTVTVLRTLRIQADAVPVKVRLINGILAAAMARHADGEQQDWKAVAEAGGKELAIGYSEPEDVRADRWNGHLIAYVPSRSVIVDASLDQARREKHGIFIPDVVLFKAVGGVPVGQPRMFINDTTGTLLIYEAIKDDSWRTAGDWQHGLKRYGHCARRIVNELTRSK